ncbi:MAG TPA: M6 family metalloprotease domain-containing protein [Gemmatimonadales bacterium]|nr:M6 family metalloprotease domain-containing protein [Gemmatimonadales bacterium]
MLRTRRPPIRFRAPPAVALPPMLNVALRAASLAAPLAALAALGPLAPALAAQYPRGEPGRFEVRGLDLRPTGGWRGRGRAVRELRRRLLQQGAAAALNARAAAGSALRLGGRLGIPVVPVTFPLGGPAGPTPMPFPPSAYRTALFHGPGVGGGYSLTTWFDEASNDALHLDGTVFDWVRAPEPDTYYEDGCHGIGVVAPCPHGGRRLGELLLHALRRLDAGPGADTLWAAFDDDGPDGRPNSGDDDGVVDVAAFLQPELDGACGTSNLWAHRYTLSALTGATSYVTRTPWAGHPGRFLTIDDYTLQSAVGGDDACSAGAMLPIGTLAHETGHVLGLPDLYDTGDPRTRTQGIGAWGLMGSGNYATPASPARLEAWSLAELGWVAVDTLRASRTVRLAPVASADTVLLVPLPERDEYFLLENRQAEESDTAAMSPARGPRSLGPGLLVWRVSPRQLALHGFDADNAVNTGPVHGLTLLQADGLAQLDRAGASSRGDTGDPFPGAARNDRLAATTVPAALLSGGDFAGFAIDSIREVAPGSAGPIVFRFLRRPRSVVTPDPVGAGAGATVRVRGTAWPQWGDVLAPGDTLTIEADSLVTSADGRAVVHFAAWSNGGSRVQRLTAGERPDTLVARYAVVDVLTVAQAAAALLGRAALTADQAARLDAAGNRNGVYDLGDFLALTRAVPDAPSTRRGRR